MSLDRGNWYVVVYANSGKGQFGLDTTHVLPETPIPYYDPCVRFPDCGMTNCPPEATSIKTGYLNAGESKTYTYQIMGDRNYTEWILTGPCGEEVIPMSIMSAGDVASMRSRYCGSVFSLYIYKDCDPRYQWCRSTRADISPGSYKYVGITYPTTGSRYYAQVYAKSGSGRYTLDARSYKCDDEIIVMMSQKPEIVSMMSTASDVAGPSSIFSSG